MPLERFAAAIGAWALGVLLLAACVLGACGSSSSGEADVETVAVRIGGAAVQAEVAADPAARERGLSGRSGLADDRGMLFVFRDRGPRAFWMKGMRFPLDIIWIDGRRVTGIARDVPVPRGDLPLYRSSGPVDRVLEVRAGWAARHGVRTGAPVVIGGGS